MQDALYLTDNWIAVAGVRYQYTPSTPVKADHLTSIPIAAMRNGRQAGLVCKVTPNVSLFANVAQSFGAAVVDRQLYRRAAAGSESTSYEVGAIRPVKRHYRQISRCLIFISVTVLYTESIGDETVAKMAGKVRSRAWKWTWPGPCTDNLGA
ncbi:TonB-dependent receptor [Klebsiella variicola subsp. variicola]|nr:TonB-dependent receptor [Klebsiella variicola subsp. variicola]